MTPERTYAALLALYPKTFRDAYGRDVLDGFREMQRANRGPAFAFWWFALGDLARSILHEQVDACRSGLRRFALQWLAVCALGVVGAALVASVTTRGFVYLYHPYLEGVQFVPWSYGALLGAGLGIAQTLALRHGFRVGLAWVTVSAASTALGFHLAALVAGVVGAVGCGLAIGAVVGGSQWILARVELHRPGWPVLASGLSLPIAVLLCDNLIQRALSGMNPVAVDVQATIGGAHAGEALNVLVRGLGAPRGWTDVAFELAAMAVSGLTIGVITARQLAGGSRAR